MATPPIKPATPSKRRGALGKSAPPQQVAPLDETAPPQETVRLEEMVMFTVIRLAKAYLRALGARLAELGLQPGQDMLLRQLWQSDGPSQSDLIKRLKVEPPTVTKALGRLEKNGLVKRQRDERNARVLRVYLTPRGKRLQEPIETIWTELEATATAGLVARDTQAARHLATALWTNLTGDNKPPPGARRGSTGARRQSPPRTGGPT